MIIIINLYIYYVVPLKANYPSYSKYNQTSWYYTLVASCNAKI